jgi:hypothetical protein
MRSATINANNNVVRLRTAATVLVLRPAVRNGYMRQKTMSVTSAHLDECLVL